MGWFDRDNGNDDDQMKSKSSFQSSYSYTSCRQDPDDKDFLICKETKKFSDNVIVQFQKDTKKEEREYKVRKQEDNLNPMQNMFQDRIQDIDQQFNQAFNAFRSDFGSIPMFGSIFNIPHDPRNNMQRQESNESKQRFQEQNQNVSSPQQKGFTKDDNEIYDL